MCDGIRKDFRLGGESPAKSAWGRPPSLFGIAPPHILFHYNVLLQTRTSSVTVLYSIIGHELILEWKVSEVWNMVLSELCGESNQEMADCAHESTPGNQAS